MTAVARRIVLLCLACALVAPAAAFAQGAFSGVVKDASGAVLPGVTVEARSPALIEGTRAVVTDSAGQYQIVDLRPGIYTLTFTLTGFSNVRRDGLELAGSRIVTIDAQLSVGGVQETVTVSGETPVVDIQSSAKQQVMSDEIIAALPAGRSHYDLAALVPVVRCRSPTARRDLRVLYLGRSVRGDGRPDPRARHGRAGRLLPARRAPAGDLRAHRHRRAAGAPKRAVVTVIG